MAFLLGLVRWSLVMLVAFLVPGSGAVGPAPASANTGPNTGADASTAPSAPPGISIAFAWPDGSPLADNATYLETGMQIMVAVCAPANLTYYAATFVTPTGSSNVLLTNDL